MRGTAAKFVAPSTMVPSVLISDRSSDRSTIHPCGWRSRPDPKPCGSPSAVRNETPEYCAGHGCARPTADTRALRPLSKFGAPPRSRSRRTRPSGDPKPLESPSLPSQSFLALRVEPRQCSSGRPGPSDRRMRCHFTGEILPELPKAKVASAEPVLPIAIGVNLINEDGPMLTAVARQIPLTITIDVEPAYHAPALNGRLPDRGADHLPRHTMSCGRPTFIEAGGASFSPPTPAIRPRCEAGLRRR
jgi:hypothetical protein